MPTFDRLRKAIAPARYGQALQAPAEGPLLGRGKSQGVLIAALLLAACGEGAEDPTGVTKAAQDVGKAATKAAQDLNAPTRASEPERSRELTVVVGTDGDWAGLLTDEVFWFRSRTHAGWYQSHYRATITSGVRELRLQGRPSTLRIMPDACADEALKATHPDRVAFAHDGASQAGCAGPLTLPGGLAGSRWLVARAGGEEPPDGAHPITTISFGHPPQRFVGGTLACNDAGAEGMHWTEEGGFTWDGESRDVASTEMGCQDDDAVAFGEHVFDVLVAAESWEIDRGELLVEGEKGAIRALYLGAGRDPQRSSESRE